MPAIVVPFRGSAAKRRFAAGEDVRLSLARAMLDDVVAACEEVGPTAVVTGGADQGSAVADALDPDRPVLVVNADVPCVRPDDLRALLAATPADGLALVEAADGTTNALSLSAGRLFAPVYGPGSAERFRALAPSVTVPVANLVDDVDTLDDLHRLASRIGPHTRAAAATLLRESA